MLFVRADASGAMGVGHAMRCLALAEAWTDLGDDVTFAMSEYSPAVRERIERAGIRVVHVLDRADAVALARRIGADFAVVDGYHLEVEYQTDLAEAGVRTLVVDDNAEVGTYRAPLVLNPNPWAEPAMYANRDPGTELLLGAQYILLRKEFRDAASGAEVAERVRRVVITFGGGDPANLTQAMIDELVAIPEIEIVAIVGATNTRVTDLGRQAAAHGGRVRIEHAVSEMAPLLASADLAVAAAGGTCWELAYLGVPFVAIVTAENQARVAEAVNEKGFGVGLGRPGDLPAGEVTRTVARLDRDRATRRAMSEKGRSFVDGKGALRVRDALLGAGGAG